MQKQVKIYQLNNYYMTLFPTKKIKLWLTYGNSLNFELREFSFVTIYNQFSRYESFKNEKDFTRKLLTENPNRIDVGPIWNQRPLWSSKKDLIPLKKELVIDIDLTDYDDIRICCIEKTICTKCWRYMIVACKIIHTSLTEDWGFKNILWVFSGRRGIHAWICDQEVLDFTRTQRSSISKFFQLISRSVFGKMRLKLTMINDFIERAVKIIDQVFVSLCVVDQDMLGSEERMKKFIELLPDRNIMEEVQKLFMEHDCSKDRWNAFLKYFQSKISTGEILSTDKYFIEEIKLLYCYPRIDRNVTAVVNHLIKLPFSIHPETNLISVPFDPEKVDSFDLTAVPSLREVVKQHNLYIRSNQLNSNQKLFTKKPRKVSYAGKTRLKTPLQVFDNFLVGLYRSRHPKRLVGLGNKEEDNEEEHIFADVVNK